MFILLEGMDWNGSFLHDKAWQLFAEGKVAAVCSATENNSNGLFEGNFSIKGTWENELRKKEYRLDGNL